MLHQMFKFDSPQKMDTDNIPSVVGNQKPLNKPNYVHKPSNFSIDHILSNAGSTRDKYMSECGNQPTNEMHNLSNDRSDHFSIENDVHPYPPILNWLQYTRYKPPRLPRKSHYVLVLLDKIDYFIVR